MEYSSKEYKDSLEECLEKISQGSQDALHTLYEQTKSAIYGFSLSILKSRQDAEDVLQETYLRVYGGAANYVPRGKPLPWMLTIAKNLSLQKLRESKRTASLPEEWEEGEYIDPDLPPEERLALKAALEELGEEERQIVMLHAVAGFKHREIAKLQDLALPTVLSKYHRAMKKLRHKLTEGWENEQ